MKSSLRKVVMSKKVASAYLEKVSKTASTVTVYFTDERGLTAFMDEAKEDFGARISSSRGFDYVLFMSTDREAIQEIQTRAKRKGLDTSGN